GNYFDVLGVRAALGRLFVASDDLAPNANPIALLSFSYWRRHFSASPAILNQTIHVNSHPFTIVGVVEPRFHSAVVGDTPDIFVPMTMRTEVVPGWNDLEDRNSSWLNIVARLRPGISKEQAAAAMSGLWHSIRTEELKQSGSHSQTYIEHALANSRLEILPGSKGLSSVRKDVGAPLI
ncbi:MAG: hypothetical protein DMG94_04480, partial [Acidobacteria bacterium]